MEGRTVVLLAGALSSFGERVWSFTLPMSLGLLYPQLLWPAAAAGLGETASCVLLGSLVGRVVDTRDRLWLMRWALALQNGSIALACGCLLLLWAELLSFWPLFVCAVLLQALNRVAAQADSVCLRKVWVPALCGAEPLLLASLNAQLRRVDLVCEIVAPLLVGLLLSFAPLTAALVAVLALNVLSFVPELLLLTKLHATLPRPATAADLGDSSLDPDAEEKAAEERVLPAQQRLSLRDAFAAWPLYAAEPVFPLSLAYCCLYVTVLSPGPLMTTFLVSVRLPDLSISAFRGACAATGILATWLAAPAVARWGDDRAALFFSWAQWLALAAGVAAQFTLPGVWAVYAFLALVVSVSLLHVRCSSCLNRWCRGWACGALIWWRWV
jgi:iron-regulated transporter 1